MMLHLPQIGAFYATFNVQVFKSIKVTCSLSLTSKCSLQGEPSLFMVAVLCIVLYPGRKMFAVFVLGRNVAAVVAVCHLALVVLKVGCRVVAELVVGVQRWQCL